MIPYIINNVRARACRLVRLCCHRVAALAPVLSLSLAACQSDWRDGIDPQETAYEQTPIAFSATVAPSTAATRADGSLINRLETSLFETKSRTYYTSTGSKTAQYSVGIFAYHTGQNTWAELSAWAANPSATDEQKEAVAKSYSPSLMYNQQMAIAAPAADGTNRLTYPADSPLRFWPNKNDGSGYGKVSFWAYYPHTATITTPSSTTPLQYGINIFSDNDGIKTGMGKIAYRMNADANEQEDFLISDLVPDLSRTTNPLIGDGSNGFTPTPVKLRFHHALAQVRLYAFVRGADRVVYVRQNGVNLKVKSINGNSTITLTDGKDPETTRDITPEGTAGIVYGASRQYYIFDRYGVTRQLRVGDSIPGDTPWLPTELKKTCQRWLRNNVMDVSGVRYRADATYAMSFNNIHTQATFAPTYDAQKGTKLNAQTVGGLGSVRVGHYIMNPYWFRFKDNQRVMLNENYMYDYFEPTAAANGVKSLNQDGSTPAADEPGFDGFDWSTKNNPNCLAYDISDDEGHYGRELKDPDDLRGHPDWHYNYAPGNIILAVPQQLRDEDVPNVRIDAAGKLATYAWDTGEEKYKASESTACTASVTINLMQMNIKWESGFIYCYAFLEDDLQPFDEKVRGPESITVVFDPTKQTDQW